MPEGVTEQFKHYQVLRRDDNSLWELGRGAMGVTYKALDTQLHCPVALKVINARFLNDDVARQRFLREARAAAQLRHPNVASIFHLGADDELYFYAMEFIDGETVEALTKRAGPFPVKTALDITDQVARALGAAARHGLIHRDIKPANLMLLRDDGDLLVKVIDFGLAKAINKGTDSSATLTLGEFVGTPYFASPEQLEEKELDIRSDIYSLGITLWFMLKGRGPFEGSVATVASSHLFKTPPFETLTGIPKDVVALLEKMLQKDRALRQQTPAELRREIARCLGRDSGDAGMISVGSPDASLKGPSDLPIPSDVTLVDSRAVRSAVSVAEGSKVTPDRFKILQRIDSDGTGNLYDAEDCMTGEIVRLRSLPDAQPSEEVTQLAAIVEKLAANPHANLIRPIAVSTAIHERFLVFEKFDGIRVVDVLRKRRELGLSETLLILGQAASAIDHAISLDLGGLQLSIEALQISFERPEGRERLQTLLGERIDSWPPFRVKIDPFGSLIDAGAMATIGGTLFNGRNFLTESGGAPGSLRREYIGKLARVAYELVGGIRPQATGGVRRYVPEASLSEAGNAILKRALIDQDSEPFSSATEFVTALRQTLETGEPALSSRLAQVSGQPARRTTVPPKTQENSVAAEQSVANFQPPPLPNGRTSLVSTPAGGVRREGPPKPPRKGLSPVAIIVTLLILLLFVAGGGVGAYKVYQIVRDKAFAREATPTPTASPAETPVPSPTVMATPEPTPADVVTPTPFETPAPTPSEEDRYTTRLEEIKQTITARDYRNALAGLLAMINEFPSRHSATISRLDSVISGSLSSAINTDFGEFENLLIEAGDVGSTAAMVSLGNHYRRSNPGSAMKWYEKAADLGVPHAMVELGQIYASDKGPQYNPVLAFDWFSKAAAKGDIGAKYLVAECFFYGKGVARNPDQAVQLLSEAAAFNHPNAVDLLGNCYLKGIGVPQNFDKAFELFQKGSQLGNDYSTGNLGVLYMNGQGVSKDARKAVALFKTGAQNGNQACMNFYAMALESGTGVEANAAEARRWYLAAAKLGNKNAIEWCRRRGIKLNGD
ncbi:MAG TPA: protein kinase [Chthoniobacterales bacterium]